MGFQEPVLPHAPLSRRRPRPWGIAAVEPLPLRRSPVRGRSAVAPLHPDDGALRLAGARAVDAALRPRGLRPLPAGGARPGAAVPAARLASGGRRGGRHRLHARRIRHRPPPAHGHNPELRVLPPRPLAAGRGDGSPLLSVRGAVRRLRRRHDHRAGSGRLPVRPHPRGHRGAADLVRTAAHRLYPVAAGPPGLDGPHRRSAAGRAGHPHHAVPRHLYTTVLRLRGCGDGLAAAREPGDRAVRQRVRIPALDLRLLGSGLAQPGRGHLDRPGHQLPVRRHGPGALPGLARDRRRAPLRPGVPFLPRPRHPGASLRPRALHPGIRGDLTTCRA